MVYSSLLIGIILGSIITWAIARTRQPNEAPPPIEPGPGTCPLCDEYLPGRAATTPMLCRTCGWRPAASIDQARTSALRALSVRALRMLQQGLLTPESYEHVSTVLSKEEDRYAEPVLPFAWHPPAAAVAAPSGLQQNGAAQGTATIEADSPISESSAHVSLGSSQTADLSDEHDDVLLEPAFPVSVPREQVPEAPSPPLHKLLMAFMEERNVRWGELVGGLLIICCSIALVISFWAQIAQRPIAQYFLFNGVTAGLFGLGFYVHRRFKLPTTSQGVLVIASLLVPLNFLAIAAIAQGTAPGDPLLIAGEGASLALFGWLTWTAGRTLADTARAALAAGLLIPSALLLVIGRLLNPPIETIVLWMLAVALIGAHMAAILVMLRLEGRESIDEATGHRLLRVLGITSFASLLGLGLLLYQSGGAAAAAMNLSPLLTLLPVPTLLIGLRLWRGTPASLSGLRVIGTALVLTAAAAEVACLILAWADPSRLLPVAAIAYAVLSYLAVCYRLTALHYAGGGCLLLAGLLIHHLVRSVIAWHLTIPSWSVSLVSLPTSQALLPLSLVLLAMAWAYARALGLRHALPYAHLAIGGSVVGPILLALLGLTSASIAARGDQAVWFGGYALLTMTLSLGPGRVLRWASEPIRFALSIVGCLAMFAAVALAIVERWPSRANLELPWLAAIISFAALMCVLAGALGRLHQQASVTARRGSFVGADVVNLKDATTVAGLIAAVLALVMWLFDSWQVSLAATSHYAWGLVGVWLLVALLVDHRAAWITSRWLLATAVLLQAALWESAATWYVTSPRPWLDVRMLQAVGIAAAVLSLVWLTARLSLRYVLLQSKRIKTAARGERAARWLTRIGHIDLGLATAATVLAVLLATYAALPGAAQELTPRRLAAALAGAANTTANVPARIVPDAAHFELPGVPHAPATGVRTWLLLALAAVWLAGGLWDRFSTLKVVALVIVAAAIVPLIAAGWEAETAVASALRWGTAAAFAALSALVWLRKPLAGVVQHAHWPGYHRAHGLRPAVVSTALAVAVLPLAAMGLFVALAAIQHRGLDAGVVELLQQSAIVAGVAGMAGLLLAASAMPADQKDSGTNDSQSASWRPAVGVLLAVLGIGPMVAVALYAVSLALRANPIVGPEPGSFFHAIGLASSYVTPTAVIALTLVGYALRERSARFAFAGGLAINLCATAGYLFSIKSGGATQAMWMNVAWLNANVAAGYGMLWSLAAAIATRRQRNTAADLGFHPLHATYAAIPIAIAASFILIRMWELFFDPTIAARWPAVAVGPLAWAAVIATVALTTLYWRLRSTAASGLLLGVSLANLGLFAALATAAWDCGNWLTFHTVQTAAVGLAWTFTVLSRIGRAGHERAQHAVRVVATVLAVAAALWSMRSFGNDPLVAWTIASLVALAALPVFEAFAARRPGRLYLAAILVNAAASIAWVHSSPIVTRFDHLVYEFLAVNVVAMCLPVPVWVAVQRTIDQRLKTAGIAHEGDTAQVPGTTIDAVASWTGLAVVGMLVWQGLESDAWGSAWAGFSQPRVSMVAAAWTTVLVAMVARLWSPRAKHVGPALYLTGVAGAGLALDAMNLEPHLLAWLGVIFAGSYAVATSYLGSRQDRFQAAMRRLGLPLRATDTGEAAEATRQRAAIGAPLWLERFNLVLSTLVVAATVIMSLTLADPSLRITAAKTGIVQAVAVGLLARGRRGSQLQRYSLAILTVGGVALAWSIQQPGQPWPILPRAVGAMVALAVVSVLLALGPGKFLPRLAAWSPAARWCLPYILGSGATALAIALSTEVYLFYLREAIPLSAGGIASLIVATAALAAASIVAALVPGRDPFALSQQQRTLYVYAAEGLLAAMLLHMRITMPWLFEGFFSRYWPIISMAVAFAGLGLAEIFRRQRRWVLAEPLERTGALLPLLTVMAFWTLPSQVDISFTLLLAGLSYATVSVMRRSFAYGIAATVAANTALWCLLDRTENWQLLQHPQVWMIPPALCVLAAVQLNRRNLDASQLTAARYAAALAIYVSSTAEIFMHGVAQTPWLAGVLAGLSVVGIFAGIGLRVRGFLYLGTSFLVVSLVTLIWHAAVDLEQTWLWSAAGIALGVAILIVFAVFEKKRHEVLGLVERLRHWEA